MNSHGTKRVNRVVAGLLGLIMMLTSLTAIVIPTFALEEPTVGARSETSANGDVFLGGNYIELGISKGGSFGTSTSPKSKTFHPHDAKNLLGMVVDNDGWDVGKAPTTGDFFLPARRKNAIFWHIGAMEGPINTVLQIEMCRAGLCRGKRLRLRRMRRRGTPCARL